ncbi:hypothetical protein WA026_006422 [Henosepilachna vigintioctopunctata]|uniref:Tetratricopeptide repeat protein 29 n=1 Tax=Henosepilachna vigintioctopunctata TaxID=420089 RepID=A0AAW1TPT1_9CUCU
MKMKGYDHSSEYIKQLIEFQDAYRNAAGADSIIWQRPRLMYQQDVLQHLAVSLQKAEDAHFLYQTDVEIDEILKLAVCYCFGLENWWWLGHQLLYLVRTTSDEYENDRGKRKAIVKYIFGRFLFYNANEPEMALVHLKTSRRISTVMSWKVDTLLPQLNKTVFQESCEILSKIRIIQAKGVMQKEPTVGIRYAELARNRAMEGCYNDGIAEAYLAKGNCLMAMGESSEAIKCYYRGLDTVEKHVNVDLKCEILKNIALAYLKEGTFDKALKTLKELKKYSQEHIKILYITQAHKFLGEFYLKEGTARKATPYLMTAVKLFAKLGLASETARTRNLAAISVGVEMMPVFSLMIRDSDPKFSSNYARLLQQLVGWKDSRESFWVADQASKLSDMSIQTIVSIRQTQQSKTRSDTAYIANESDFEVTYSKVSEPTASYATQEYSIPTNVQQSSNTLFPPSTMTDEETSSNNLSASSSGII